MSSTWLATPHGEKIGIAEQQLLEESYSITDDGRVRPKHVLIEFEK
jgi:hypothetical protein